MKPTQNKLRVEHYPQYPNKEAFFVDVKDEEQALFVKNVLADQHLFLYNNNIIDDYSNIIVVLMFNEEDQEWEEYYNEEEGMDWDDLVNEYFSVES
jgi:hypothetical protein